MKKRYLIMGLVIILLLSQFSAIADSSDGEPEITPHPVEVDPGDTFDLEVSIKAGVNSSYTVTFTPRSRFSFPGENYKKYDMEFGDAILFKVKCKVDSDAPDGDFNVSFKVTWEYNGSTQELDGAVLVSVGEGSKTEEKDGDACEGAMIIAAISSLAMLLVVVRKRRIRE